MEALMAVDLPGGTSMPVNTGSCYGFMTPTLSAVVIADRAAQESFYRSSGKSREPRLHRAAHALLQHLRSCTDLLYSLHTLAVLHQRWSTCLQIRTTLKALLILLLSTL